MNDLFLLRIIPKEEEPAAAAPLRRSATDAPNGTPTKKPPPVKDSKGKDDEVPDGFWSGDDDEEDDEDGRLLDMSSSYESQTNEEKEKGKDKESTPLPFRLKWERLSCDGPEPAARAYHSATMVGQRLFIFGGIGGFQSIEELAILDIPTWTWYAFVYFNGFVVH